MIKLLDVVRVVRLFEPSRDLTGTTGILRQPRVGDEGTVVLMKKGTYLVESVTDRGETVFVASFTEGEIERVPG